MRKNKESRTHLDVYTSYEVRGVNLDLLTETLKKKGIVLYGMKKMNNKRIILKIKYADNRKFFAIFDNLCYNTYKVKKLGHYGKAYPLLYFAKNSGLIIGALLFIFFSYFVDGYIFSVSYQGSGSVYKNKIDKYLEENGVKKFTRFSSVDLKKLSDNLLIENDGLTFCECKKEGNRLIIDCALAENGGAKKVKYAENLISTEDGVIKEIKAYRGTPTKNVGDSVFKGDILISGKMKVGDTAEVETGVLGLAVIEKTYTYTYISESENDGDTAVIFAESQSEFNAKTKEINIQRLNGEYYYIITLAYTVTVYAY